MPRGVGRGFGPGADTPALLSAYRIVLTDGRFVEAVGFTLNDDGTIATPIAISEEVTKAGVVDLSLTWR